MLLKKQPGPNARSILTLVQKRAPKQILMSVQLIVVPLQQVKVPLQKILVPVYQPDMVPVQQNIRRI